MNYRNNQAGGSFTKLAAKRFIGIPVVLTVAGITLFVFRLSARTLTASHSPIINPPRIPCNDGHDCAHKTGDSEEGVQPAQLPVASTRATAGDFASETPRLTAKDMRIVQDVLTGQLGWKAQVAKSKIQKVLEVRPNIKSQEELFDIVLSGRIGQVSTARLKLEDQFCKQSTIANREELRRS